jgi:hypothetical protein
METEYGKLPYNERLAGARAAFAELKAEIREKQNNPTEPTDEEASTEPYIPIHPLGDDLRFSNLKRQERAMSGRQGEITVTDTEIHLLKNHKMCIKRAMEDGHDSDYARGIHNGIEFALALIEHREPELIETAVEDLKRRVLEEFGRRKEFKVINGIEG